MIVRNVKTKYKTKGEYKVRELKFRALSKHDLKYIEKGEKGFMFYQQVIKDKDGIPELWFVNEKDPDFRYRFEVVFLDDDWCKMEYIGHKDKNDREVYERDIIDFSHPKEKRKIPGEIIWNEKDACFAINWLSKEVRRVRKEAGMPNLPGNLVHGGRGNPWEVIGDIFQNKDLLNLT